MSDAFFLYTLNKSISQIQQNNRHLAQIIAGENARKSEEQRQVQLRDGLLKQIQILKNSPSQGPAVAFWNSLNYQIWLEENEISQESFVQLGDKERFIESYRLASELNAQSGKELSDFDRAELQAGRSGWSAALLIWSGVVWKTILQRMTPNIPFLQGIIWNGNRSTMFSYSILTICIFLIIIAPVIVLLAIALRIADFFRYRKAKKLAVLAESVGGSFGSRAKLSDVQEIVNSYESGMESLGVPARRLTPDQLLEAYEREAGKTYAVNEKFGLSLDLSGLPRRIGAL